MPRREYITYFIAYGVVALFLSFNEAQQNQLKIYKISCEHVNFNYIAKNWTCRVKAINRHKGSADMTAWLLKPLLNITAVLKLYKHTGTQFHPYLVNVKYNFCELWNGSLPLTYIIRLFNKDLEKTTNVAHKCPITIVGGYLYGHDLGINISKVRLPIPMGRFKYTVLATEGFHSGADEVLVEVSFYFDVYQTKYEG